MKIQSNTQTRHCPQCGTVMEDQAVTWVNVQEELVSVASIRADERRRVLDELIPIIFSAVNLNSPVAVDALQDKVEKLRREGEQ